MSKFDWTTATNEQIEAEIERLIRAICAEMLAQAGKGGE